MSSKSLAEKALAVLCERSEKARIMFGQEVLNRRMGFEKADQAIEKYLLTWNDTIRQGIVSIAVEAVGGTREQAIPLQVALTFIDATMDIHDDVIDDSLKKKTIKTIYGKLGKGSAVLIGDDLIVRGFHQMHKAIAHLPKEKQVQIMDILSGSLSEVVKAHIAEAELKSTKWMMKPQTYLNILTQKAAEIEGRMKIAAIYGGGTENQIQALGKYGRNLGILLAVRAEFTDLFDPEELTNRAKFECLPLHILYAIQKRETKKKIRMLLLQPNFAKKDVSILLQTIFEAEALDDLNCQLRNLRKEAICELIFINNEKEKKHFELIVTALLEDL